MPMKKTSFYILILIGLCSFIHGCGESECSLSTTSFARFDFQDSKTHAAIGFTQRVTITGISQTENKIQEDTLFNLAESSMSLPLSYAHKTTYVMHYSEVMRDTIELTHKNIPFVSDIECGTLMHYKVEEFKYTTHALDSVVLINPEITNEEKRNFIIYYRIAESE